MKTLPIAALSIALSLPLAAQEPKPAPTEPAAEAKEAPAQKLEISSKPGGLMKYEQTEIKAKAGVPIALTFKNPDVLQHNLLVLRPGSKEKVGALADAMISDPTAIQKGYVPKSSDILHATKLLSAGQSETLTFTLDTPGEYPILCTFPGHWRLMFAVLKVEK